MNELGELRPSQLIFTFGVGSLVDLPKMSALIMGLDDWDTRYCKEIDEDRLIAAVQNRLGTQLSKLYLPPINLDATERDPAAPAIGVPVAPFPRWLRCSLCDTLATLDSGVFQLSQDRFHPDKTQYVHQGCTRSKGSGRPPTATSARFLLACRGGHMTDFPWVTFVHQGNAPCKPSQLTLREYGASGEASDIIVTCLSCTSTRRMADAFDSDSSYSCSGHHPHLRLVEDGCNEVTKPILLGASNSWFPTALSALSIPRATDKLGKILDEHWVDLKDTDSIDELRLMRKKIQKFQSLIPLFTEFKDEEIWSAIETKRTGSEEESHTEDLKLPEWLVFSSPTSAEESKDFKLTEVAPPRGFESIFENTVLVERIREVRALIGFTRIESNSDFAEATRVTDARLTRLRREPPTWLPASEVRGEGIFLRIREEAILEWEAKPEVQKLRDEFLASHIAWRRLRKIEPFDGNFPGMRLVFLHSLAHALMRQIVLDCGYSAASIRERLYSRVPGEDGGPMGGILLYTAAPDSEGTLGGLVELGDTLTLGRHMQQALESMRLCASDPLCAEHHPDTTGRGIHGACCHACEFAPETSCEHGNRYLDRSVLVETFMGRGAAMFE
jgi:hypothetical protein